MPYYSLLTDTDKTLSASAGDRSEALAVFGKELGQKLSLEDSDAAVVYLLDEWQEQHHFVNHHIRVFAAPI
jgi:hypothetical protein